MCSGRGEHQKYDLLNDITGFAWIGSTAHFFHIIKNIFKIRNNRGWIAHLLEFIIVEMSRKFTYIGVLVVLIAAFLVFRPQTKTVKIGGGKVENCLLCHNDTPSPDKNHSKEALGCSSCHLGNPYATKKSAAHEGIVRNPANLPFAEITCGACHMNQVKRVKLSIMATNTGIINTLRYQWNEIPEPEDTITLYNIAKLPRTLAVSHYRKFCSTCHIWKRLNDLKGEIGTRGGGCIDCHIKKRSGHAEITTRIPSKNCTKCHNRSARVGLSYYGKFESEGYGTPYFHGMPNRKKLSGGRFYRHLLPDIHSEYGLECIDCHTSTGLMGDGKLHHHVENQVDITCEDCHNPVFHTVRSDSDSAVILANLNQLIKIRPGDTVAVTRKHSTPIYNVKLKNGKLFLFRKLSGDSVEITPMSKSPYHTLGGHDELSCQACHSAWIPQCYGCHDIYRKDLRQLDKINYKRTRGRWEERRSYLRYEHPTLAHGPGEKIYPVAPGCQVYLTTLKNPEELDSSMSSFALAVFDPHTTRLASRACQDCHLNPKTIGLGEGNLFKKGNRLVFKPIYDSKLSFLEIPLESFTDLEGNPIQKGSRPYVKPLTKNEIKKVLIVGYCIQCHSSYYEPIYKDFKSSLQVFQNGKCPGAQTD